VGKALHDGVLLQPYLSKTFLSRLLKKPVYFDDLHSLDPTLYASLQMLKRFDGNFEDLGLTMSLTESLFGKASSIPLIPGGENIPVDRGNVLTYLRLVAEHKLETTTKRQTEAFMHGLDSVIPIHYLSIFSQDELQLLISGSGAGFDLENMRTNVEVTGGNEELMTWFWDVVEEFSAEERGSLLQFWTGCRRAPLLGFEQMTPRIRIYWGGDSQSLPTSATCGNLLRLPEYTSKEQLRRKIVYAINSGSAFGLA
jgi:ubiquitin-protein ligase E3 C